MFLKLEGLAGIIVEVYTHIQECTVMIVVVVGKNIKQVGRTCAKLSKVWFTWVGPNRYALGIFTGPNNVTKHLFIFY